MAHDGVDNNFLSAVSAAPSIATSPGLLSGIATGSTDLTNAADNAQMIAHLTQTEATGQALDKAKEHTSFMGSVFHALGGVARVVGEIPGVKPAASFTARVLNAGLKNAQHEYRYLRDVELRHGPMAALGELTAAGLGAAVGGTAGFFVGGPAGAWAGGTAGAEGGSYLSRFIGPSYQESWERTKDQEGVSLGRDVANSIPFLRDHKLAYKLTSGSIDGLFDLAIDPTVALGKFNAARSLVGEGGAELEGLTASRIALASRFGVLGPEGFDKAYELNSRFRRAVDMAVNADNVHDIKRLIPSVSDETAARLAAARNVLDVRDIYVDSNSIKGILDNYPMKSWLGAKLFDARKPTLGIDQEASANLGQAIAGRIAAPLSDETVTKLSDKYQLNPEMVRAAGERPLSELSQSRMQATAEAAAGGQPAIPADFYADVQREIANHPAFTQFAQKQGNVITRSFERFTRRANTTLPLEIDYETGEQDLKAFHIQGERASDIIYNYAKLAYNDRVAQEVRNIYQEADTPERVLIYKNLIAANAWQMGLNRHPDAFKQFMQEMNDNVDRVQGYAIAPGGTATDSDPLSKILGVDANGGTRLFHAALYSSQTGKMALPAWTDLKYGIAQLDRFKGMAFRADEFLYSHMTQRFFKRLALLSGGFAQRIALGESTYGVLKDGITNTMTARVGTALAKFGYHRLSKKELEEEAASRVEWATMGVGEAIREKEKEAAAEAASPEFQNKIADVVTRLMVERDGHLVPPALDPSHIAHDTLEAPTHSITQMLLKGGRNSQRVSYVPGAWKTAVNVGDHEDIDFRRFLAGHLNTISDDPFARKIAGDYVAARASMRPAEDGFVRLYKGASKQDPWFTDLRKAQESTALPQVRLRYIDVPKEKLPEAADDGSVPLPAMIAKLRETKHGVVVKDEADAREYAVEQEMSRLLSDHANAPSQRLMRYMDRAHDSALANNGGWEGFARARLMGVLGATTGRNGEVQEDLLRAMAEKGHNGKITSALLKDKLPDELPSWAPGQEAMPYMETSLDRIANAGFSKVISPIIRHFSRDPIYALKVQKHLEELTPLVDEGRLSSEEAWQFAQQRAMYEMIREVHNPELRTQLSTNLRNFVPFWFAQDQAYRRWGRLIQQDPFVLRKLQLVHQAGTNTGFVTKDQSGNEVFNYPVSGFIGTNFVDIANRLGMKSFTGMPLQWHGNIQSLSSVTPFAEAPGMRFSGPIVGVPLKLLEHFAPESTGMQQEIAGPKGQNQTAWQMILPNTMLQDLAGVVGLRDNSRAFQSAMMQALQEEMYRAENDPKHPFNYADPLAYQHMLTKAKEYARTLYLLKAVMGEVEPTQPALDIGNIKIKDEFAALRKKYPTMGEALDALQKAHPDENLSAFSVFQSANPRGQAYIPPTQEALDFFQQHRSFLEAAPYGGAWLIPQAGKATADAMKVYNEQLALGLRTKRSPEEFQKALYVAAGNAQYYQLKDSFDAFMKTATDPTVKATAQKVFNAWVQTHSMQNPVWAEDHLSGSTRDVERQRTLADFAAIFDPKRAAELPQGEQTQLVGELYGLYLRYHQAREEIKLMGSAAPTTATALDAAWQGFLEQRAKDEPRLAPVIQKVFQEVK